MWKHLQSSPSKPPWTAADSSLKYTKPSAVDLVWKRYKLFCANRPLNNNDSARGNKFTSAWARFAHEHEREAENTENKARRRVSDSFSRLQAAIKKQRGKGFWRGSLKSTPTAAPLCKDKRVKLQMLFAHYAEFVPQQKCLGNKIQKSKVFRGLVQMSFPLCTQLKFTIPVEINQTRTHMRSDLRTFQAPSSLYYYFRTGEGKTTHHQIIIGWI